MKVGYPGSVLLCASLLKLGFLVFAILVGASLWADTYVNFEGKLTRPICLSPDGTRLFAVNTPDARLSVFDVTHPLTPFLIAEIPVGIEPVSVNALNNDEVWVVNEVSDSVSVVSVTNRLVADTLYTKDEPMDVVFAGGKAFVSESRNRQMAVFDIASHALLTNIVLFGENPRSLVVNSNATKIYAAFALSGNRTTIISLTNAPPQSPPTNPNLPAGPQVSLIVDATDPTWNPSFIKFNMPDNDVAEIDVATMTISRYFSRIGTVNLGIAIQPGSGDLFVANTDARNLTHFEPGLKGFFATNRVTRISVTDGTTTSYDLNSGYNPTVFTLTNRINALAQPSALVFEPAGTNLYVAAFGSDRIARLDAASGAVLSRIELCPTATGSASDSRNMRGPRGLALKAGAALYVLNRISGTISVINPLNEALVTEIPIGSYDPTTPVIRQGRGFLYDAKLSGNGTVSCASCHVDGEMDMLAWDLGDPGGQLSTNKVVSAFNVNVTNNATVHPMKGPMVTQTLRGLNTLDPFHWRGDRTNFTHFNIAFTNLLGGSALPDADMNAYRDFINTIQFEPNPNQNLDRTLPLSLPGTTGSPQTGFTNFALQTFAPGTSCTTCHSRPEGTGRLLIDPTSFQTVQAFKVPHLRNIYQKMDFNPTAGSNSVTGFGISHDGPFRDPFAWLSRPFFEGLSVDTTKKNNLMAFLLCFDTGTAPTVGYTRTVTMGNVNSGNVMSDWSLLEAQAALGTNVDLIAKGTIDGRRRGLLYQPGPHTYLLDSTNSTPITHAQLVAKISVGDTVSFMGVPPGSGRRMGIDRNLNGILDADEPSPRLEISQSSGNVVLNWPLSAAGYVLQQTPSLATGSWSNSTNAVVVLSNFNFVTNVPAAAAVYFRLRQQ